MCNIVFFKKIIMPFGSVYKGGERKYIFYTGEDEGEAILYFTKTFLISVYLLTQCSASPTACNTLVKKMHKLQFDMPPITRS